MLYVPSTIRTGHTRRNNNGPKLPQEKAAGEDACRQFLHKCTKSHETGCKMSPGSVRLIVQNIWWDCRCEFLWCECSSECRDRLHVSPEAPEKLSAWVVSIRCPAPEVNAHRYNYYFKLCPDECTQLLKEISNSFLLLRLYW